MELDYGEGGNVTAMTVHGQCGDAPAQTCGPPEGATIDDRRENLRERCVCQVEQHYRYRWDELNRLAEARRYDRERARGRYELVVRQRYRYDAGNQRTFKQTLESDPDGDPDPPERVQLYAYPGDYVRSGLTRQPSGYAADETLGSETQYLVGGARIVWKKRPDGDVGLGRDARITYALTDLIQSTSAVIDLYSGELLEVQTFHPNGAQETHLTQHDIGIQREPLGFTGKEEDGEVGLVYFGERYLIPTIGRWASPDPLHVHAAGGGEALNSFHYARGNVLQARDPLGLAIEPYSEGFDAPTGGDPWNPGQMPVRYYIGLEAHRRIAAYYETQHPDSQIMSNTRNIRAIVGAADGNPSEVSEEAAALRPDIVNLDTGEIYEIKPWRGHAPGGQERSIAEAESQLTAYQAGLSQGGIPTIRGPSFDPGVDGSVPAPGGGRFEFWSPRPGVILYRHIPRARDRTQEHHEHVREPRTAPDSHAERRIVVEGPEPPPLPLPPRSPQPGGSGGRVPSAAPVPPAPVSVPLIIWNEKMRRVLGGGQPDET